MAKPACFTLFDTTLGRCAILWGDRGIIGLQLPEADDNKARARLLRRFPDASEATPPKDVEQAIASILALLCGEPADLSGIALDMGGVPAFDQRVYEVARSIRPGATLTYGEVAAQISDRNAARAVGRALGSNPFPIIVPCHWVVAAAGKLGGFSAPGGAQTKLRLLDLERAHSGGNGDPFSR